MTHRVLLIDDNDANRLTLSALLETEDFVVTQASSLADAREVLARTAPFDLILLDRHLRDGSGIELIPVVRGQLPRAKIIVISGCGNRPESGVEDADAYFGKGEQLDELLDRMHALLT